MGNDTITLKGLSALLEPAIRSLKSIENSLSILADVQLVNEFLPEHAERAEVYAKLDRANQAHRNSQKTAEEEADKLKQLDLGSYEAYSADHGKEAADEKWSAFLDAHKLTTVTFNQLYELEQMFPAFCRLNKLAPN